MPRARFDHIGAREGVIFGMMQVYEIVAVWKKLADRFHLRPMCMPTMIFEE